MSQAKPVYLDYNATTPLSPKVIDAMRPFLEQHFGNPSSQHFYGQIAHQAVETARRQVALCIHARPDEIIFTSGGTESNNMALLGTAQSYRTRGLHIITSAVEHPAVTEVYAYLQTLGFSITILPVDRFGMVSPEILKAALRADTILVSVMHANNEVGTIQPIQQLVQVSHEAGALFHTDAAQTIGKIPVNVTELGVDLLSIAGHKLYAPKGVGALYIHNGIQLEKIIFGAGQERGLRPGTENVLEIVGLGQAAQEARQDLVENMTHFKAMRDQLHTNLIRALGADNIHLNGHPENRLPNTLNVSFKGIEANTLLEEIRTDVAASAGAACHAGQVRVSSVIEAMGVPVEWAKGTLRFSVGRMTTEKEIDRAAAAIVRAVKGMTS